MARKFLNGPGLQSETFSYTGTLPASYTGTFRIYNDSGVTRTLQSTRASLGTAPTGQAAIFDLNKNGSTMFTTQGDRNQIAVSTNTDTAVPNVTSWPPGDYLTVDIDQKGSTVAGADLTYTIWYL